MILRLSSPAARVLLALLASMLATALSYSGIRNAPAVHDAELNTPEGYQRAIRLEPDEATNCVLPPTEDSYFSVIYSLCEQQQADQALLVWSRLAALHPHMLISQSYPLLEVLFQKRRMAEAQRVWDEALAFAGITRPSAPRGSLVWDGGFESNIAKGGLPWYYPTFIGGVQLTLDAKERHSGNRSLRLTCNGLRNINFNDVCQYGAVQPSTSYRFSAWVGTQDISTDQGVRFGLPSLSDALNSRAWTDDVRGTQAWTEVELRWTSGNDVCELHLCVRRLPSAKFPSKIGGSAWIDDVSLVGQSAENTKQ